MTDAFEKLSRLKVGALFMETGTGKTKIALDLMAYKSHKVDYMLWICPCSLKGEIEQERLKWHPELTFDVVGCESLGSSDRIYLETLEKVKTHKAFIIVDESLKIKNTHAKRTQRIITIGDHAEYKLILNGTPVSKNIADLWSQMEFLSPKILNMSKHDFDRRYVRYGEMKIGKTDAYGREITRKVPIGSKNVNNLIGLISPYIYESKLEIESKKHYHTYSYNMNHDELDAYEDLKEELFYGKDSDNMRALKDIDFYSITTQLQHHYCQCNGHREALLSLVDKIDDKVVVFVKYLSSVPDDALSITGSTKERQSIIQQFRDGEDKVLYITYGCGAYGLNLQFCHNIIFAEHGFDYATRLQAEARIYRMGQTEDVHYYDLECDIGLERLFTKCLWNKSDLLQEVKNEIEKNGLKSI